MSFARNYFFQFHACRLFISFVHVVCFRAHLVFHACRLFISFVHLVCSCRCFRAHLVFHACRLFMSFVHLVCSSRLFISFVHVVCFRAHLVFHACRLFISFVHVVCFRAHLVFHACRLFISFVSARNCFQIAFPIRDNVFFISRVSRFARRIYIGSALSRAFTEQGQFVRCSAWPEPMSGRRGRGARPWRTLPALSGCWAAAAQHASPLGAWYLRACLPLRRVGAWCCR